MEKRDDIIGAVKMETKKMIVKAAKEIVQEVGFHPSKFFIELPDGRLAHVSVEAKSDTVVAALKEMVESTNSSRYHSVFDTMIVEEKDVVAMANEKIKKYASMKRPNDKSLAKLLIDLARISEPQPTRNPLGRNAIVFTTYDKASGMDVEIHPYEKDEGGKVKFKPAKKDVIRNMYNPYNVWSPHQIDLR